METWSAVHVPFPLTETVVKCSPLPWKHSFEGSQPPQLRANAAQAPGPYVS